MHIPYAPRSRRVVLALVVLLAAAALFFALGGHLTGVGHLFGSSPQWSGRLASFQWGISA